MIHLSVKNVHKYTQLIGLYELILHKLQLILVCKPK